MIAVFYAAGSLDAILNSAPNYPVASIMAQSFNNTNAAFGCGLIIFIASITGQVGFQIVAVRSIWAFARDGALPFSNFFSKIDERSVMPARANILIGTATRSSMIYQVADFTSYLTAVITTALGALYVASTTAFNALVASYAVMSTTSFGFAIGVHLFTGRKRVAPGWFHLGDGFLGFFINGVALVYILVSNVFFCLPYNRPPVDAKTMNYTSLVSYGMAILVVIWWFIGGKKSYRGPKLSGETQDALEGMGMTPRENGEQHVERGSVRLTEKEKS